MLVFIPLVTIGVVCRFDRRWRCSRRSSGFGFDWWNFKVFTTTKIFIVVILFGAGTDFCLFLISRFREELERGRWRQSRWPRRSAALAARLVGSAMTTICGLGMMYFADFGKFRNSGPAIAVVPAWSRWRPASRWLPRCCGPAAKSLLAVRRRAAAPAQAATTPCRPRRVGGFWDWASRVIVARPGLILVVSVLVLLPLAYAARDRRDLRSAQRTAARPAERGGHANRALRHFPAGELTPVTVLAMPERPLRRARRGRTSPG